MKKILPIGLSNFKDIITVNGYYVDKTLNNKKAIAVYVKGVGRVGYVANSTRTVLGECMSAGRIYDRLGKKACGKVLHITDRGVICTQSKKSIRYGLTEIK